MNCINTIRFYSNPPNTENCGMKSESCLNFEPFRLNFEQFSLLVPLTYLVGSKTGVKDI